MAFKSQIVVETNTQVYIYVFIHAHINFLALLAKNVLRSSQMGSCGPRGAKLASLWKDRF